MEKTKAYLAAYILLIMAVMQILAWIYGFDGQFSQLLGTVFGIIIGYFFKGKLDKK